MHQRGPWGWYFVGVMATRPLGTPCPRLCVCVTLPPCRCMDICNIMCQADGVGGLVWPSLCTWCRGFCGFCPTPLVLPPTPPSPSPCFPRAFACRGGAGSRGRVPPMHRPVRANLCAGHRCFLCQGQRRHCVRGLCGSPDRVLTALTLSSGIVVMCKRGVGVAVGYVTGRHALRPILPW